ncbi:MAG: hypothetical protein AB7O50_05750 [Pseudolabrys sp.]
MDTLRSDPPELLKKLQLARAAALEAYSDLEQQLCLQFADLIDADVQKASIVFYRITNTHSRNRIIDTLIESEFGDEYQIFWRSVLKLIRQLDQTRNEFIHWHVLGQDGDEEQPGIEPDEVFVLASHNPAGSEALTTSGLWKFVEKTEFVRLQLVMFYLFHLSRPSPEARKADKTYEAFRQPVVYPPPSTPTGFHFGPIPETPPRPPEE